MKKAALGGWNRKTPAFAGVLKNLDIKKAPCFWAHKTYDEFIIPKTTLTSNRRLHAMLIFKLSVFQPFTQTAVQAPNNSLCCH